MRTSVPTSPTRVSLHPEQVCFEYAELDGLGPRGLSELDIDLLHVVAAVKLADRRVMRRRSPSARMLDVVVPVLEPDRWSAPVVRHALTEVLEYATGDSWSLFFVHERREARDRALPFVDSLSKPKMVIPYSGGLDSYAALRLASTECPDSTVLMTLVSGRSVRDLVRVTSKGHSKSFYQLGFPISLNIGRHCEPSARTRTFQFFVVAALAARLLGAAKVVIPESGQGGLGPSIVGYDSEFPYRGTSPALSSRIRKFLSAVWGDCPPFVHPYLWSTKGQVLERLADRGLLSGWTATRSCARPLARKKHVDKSVECGVCANCLLTRVSLHHAGVQWADHVGRYLWGNLRASSLAKSINRRKFADETNSHDEDLAYSAVAIHEDLASVNADSREDPAIEQMVYEIGKALSMEPENVRHKVRELIRCHRGEWRAFVDELPEDSWIRRRCGGE